MSSQTSPEFQMKQSFERFGDDLSELIFSYLTLEDKFRFECLSKQIQSLIFNKHFILNVTAIKNCYLHSAIRAFGPMDDWTDGDQEDEHYNKIKRQMLDKCLRKVKFLNEILIDGAVYCDEPLLPSIADNCRYLRRLSFDWYYQDLREQTIEYLGQKCGQNIKHLSINTYYKIVNHEKLRQLLSFTSQLVSLKISRLDSRILLNQNSEKLLPKLKEINCDYYSIDDMIAIQKAYGNQLVSIKAKKVIDNNNEDDEEVTNDMALVPLASCFGQFRRLHTLELRFRFGSNVQQIHDICRQFAKLEDNCPQLTRLTLHLYDVSGRHNNFWFLTSFSRLTSLDITLWDKHFTLETNGRTNIRLSFEHFTQLTQLKHLKICFRWLSDSKVADIYRYLPQLESLVILTDTEISDRSLETLFKLKQLKSLHIHSRERIQISDSGIKQLLDNCQHLRRLVLKAKTKAKTDSRQRSVRPRSVNISPKSVEYFKARAKQNPKVEYRFSFQPVYQRFPRGFLTKVPANLKIVTNPKP